MLRLAKIMLHKTLYPEIFFCCHNCYKLQVTLFRVNTTSDIPASYTELWVTII